MAASNGVDAPRIAEMVEEARKTFESGKTRPLEWRLTQLSALKKAMEENKDRVMEALKKDLGRSVATTLLTDYCDTIAQIKYCRENVHKWMQSEHVPAPLLQRPLAFRVMKEPMGVVAIFGTWNFPLSILIPPLAGAIAAGNAAIVKPSELAAHCEKLVVDLVAAYLDTDAIKVIPGGIPEATALLEQKFDKIMYTGNGKVARIVAAAAAKHLTPTTLELGGQCPLYVDKSANLQVTARRMVSNKLINMGQICLAPNHALVHAEVWDEFLKITLQQLEKLYPGDKLKNKDLCRIVNLQHTDRLKAMLEEDHGGKLLCGGTVHRDDKFIDPTIVLEPKRDSKMMQEEIFGPILPVFKVSGLDEVEAFVGKENIPLAAYVCAEDKAVSEAFLQRIPSGGACVNDMVIHLTCNEAPFGGKGESGTGAYRGRYSFENFTHRKTVALQTTKSDPQLRYPPYSEKKVQILSTVLSGESPFPAWVMPAAVALGVAAVAAIVCFLCSHVSVQFVVSFH